LIALPFIILQKTTLILTFSHQGRRDHGSVILSLRFLKVGGSHLFPFFFIFFPLFFSFFLMLLKLDGACHQVIKFIGAAQQLIQPDASIAFFIAVCCDKVVCFSLGTG